MSPALVLIALGILLLYGAGMFYLGVKAAVDDYERRLELARQRRYERNDRDFA